MKIHNIFLKNFRGFKDFSLSFNDSVNVLYGLNGVGKSTIIQALANLRAIINNKNGVPFNQVLIPSECYYDPNKDVSIGMEVMVDRKKCSFYIIRGKESWNISNKLDTSEIIQGQARLINQFQEGQSLADGTYFKGNLTTLKKVVCHTLRFMPGAIDDNIETKRGKEGLEIKIDRGDRFAVIKGITHLRHFLAWFKEREDLELQFKVEKDASYEDNLLRRFRRAVIGFDSSFGRIKVDRSLPNKPVLVEKNGIFLPINQLSDGEASVIAIIGLMSSVIDNSETKDLVVLFDEIDNSLHPKWQRKIINHFYRLSPSWQFIVSSHSPFVWAELDRNQVIHLERGDDGEIYRKNIAYAKGGSYESIIMEHFDLPARSPDVASEIIEIELLIRDKNGTGAREKMNAIREKYGDFPELTRLTAMIHGLGI